MTKKALIGSLILALGLCGAAWAAEAPAAPAPVAPVVASPVPPPAANFTPAAPQEPLLLPDQQEIVPKACGSYCCPSLTDEECFQQCYAGCGINGVCDSRTRNCICTTMW
ncbi:MAG TPA: hypothetical protein VGG03_21660 [Thermoanaerobaculia bacterium]|jgi:hypothetical protein